MNEADLWSKVDHEGGIVEALEYGLRSFDIEPGPLREEWAKLEEAWHVFEPRLDMMQAELDDIEARLED